MSVRAAVCGGIGGDSRVSPRMLGVQSLTVTYQKLERKDACVSRSWNWAAWHKTMLLVRKNTRSTALIHNTATHNTELHTTLHCTALKHHCSAVNLGSVGCGETWGRWGDAVVIFVVMAFLSCRPSNYRLRYVLWWNCVWRSCQCRERRKHQGFWKDSLLRSRTKSERFHLPVRDALLYRHVLQCCCIYSAANSVAIMHRRCMYVCVTMNVYTWPVYHSSTVIIFSSVWTVLVSFKFRKFFGTFAFAWTHILTRLDFVCHVSLVWFVHEKSQWRRVFMIQFPSSYPKAILRDDMSFW